MKPTLWVSAALTCLSMLAGYQQYANTSYALAQELPARLKSETNIVVAQLNDYVARIGYNQPTDKPYVFATNIGYSLTFLKHQPLQPVRYTLESPVELRAPAWFSYLFSRDDLSQQHMFYLDNVKHAVLTTEISADEIIDNAWFNYCVLIVAYLLVMTGAMSTLRRQERRHVEMARRLSDGVSLIRDGHFHSIRQMRKDRVFRLLVVEFNQLVVQLEHQHKVISKEKKWLSATALFDDLTGFGNKPMLNRAMVSKQCSDQSHGYLVLLRLDSLEKINATLGCDEGDGYISRVSHLLNTSCGASKERLNTFRLSGRDFTAILPADSHDNIKLWAQKLRKSLSDIDNSDAINSGGIFAIVPFDQSSKLSSLMARLEAGISQAMIHSAQGYYIHHGLHDTEIDCTNWYEVIKTIIRTKGVILNKQQLKHRLENPNLYNFELFASFVCENVHYQAKDIFAAASRLSLGAELDKVIIERLQSFNDTVAVSNARYLIKLSYESILDIEFYHWLKQWLAQEDNLASKLSFEIPGIAISENYTTAKQFIAMLHVTNTSVCLDYEGSQCPHKLSRMIGELEIDMVKVNGYYTHRVDKQQERASFVAALVDIAHSIDVPVIASQVEHNEEWHQLETLGVDAAQGNLFGHVRPV